MFATDIKDDVVGTNRSRGEQRAIDHQVRPGGHQRAVLEAQWLTLGAVRQHDRAAASALGDRSPLAADGETGPTAAEQAAGLELGDQGARRKGRHWPEALKMRGQAFCAGRASDQLHFWACGEVAGRRRHAVCGATVARQATAATTLPMQPASMASIHAKRGSVPVPMPWMTATGHIA